MTLSNINHGDNLRLPLHTQNPEKSSALGGFAPDLPPGALLLRAPPPDPRYWLALRARRWIKLNLVWF